MSNSYTMTPETAICVLQAANEHFNNNTIQEAFDMAVEAIQSNKVAVKRIVLRFDDAVRVGAAIVRSGAKVYKCPKCHTFVLSSHRYCHYCGQAFKDI